MQTRTLEIDEDLETIRESELPVICHLIAKSNIENFYKLFISIIYSQIQYSFAYYWYLYQVLSGSDSWVMLL